MGDVVILPVVRIERSTDRFVVQVALEPKVYRELQSLADTFFDGELSRAASRLLTEEIGIHGNAAPRERKEKP